MTEEEYLPQPQAGFSRQRGSAMSDKPTLSAKRGRRQRSRVADLCNVR